MFRTAGAGGHYPLDAMNAYRIIDPAATRPA
jgi:hypothetical protein